MRVGSLFSGIGGIDLGLERAGMRVAWQCESDPDCRRVLATNWPSVHCYPDVATLRGSDTAPIDLLAGGFPCQDISNAGQRSGITGEQSGLWAHFARLIRELRPRYVLVENVPGLLVRGMGRVLADLSDVGFDAEWDVLPAASFGASHLRARVWLLAYPRGERDDADNTVFAGRTIPFVDDRWPAEPSVPRMADGTPGWLVRALGNAAVPACAEHIGRLVMEQP